MEQNPIATYPTRQAAQAIVDHLDRAQYILAHGEYERPDYSVRKVRGQDEYYIHAKRYYYAGTLGAEPSDPLRVNDNELYRLQ